MSQSGPIQFVASYTPTTVCPLLGRPFTYPIPEDGPQVPGEVCKACPLDKECFEEEFVVVRETAEGDPPEYDKPLPDWAWFDEELNSLGAEEFIEACGLTDDVKKHGKVRARVAIHTYQCSEGDWDSEFIILDEVEVLS